MVSNSELIERLGEFLRNSDLDTTTTGTVRRQLEEDFGTDFSDRKAFIREQVDLFLQSHFQNAKDESQEPGDDDQTAKIQSEETEGSDSKEEDEDDDGGDDDEEEEVNNGKSTAKRGLSSNYGLPLERKTYKTPETALSKHIWPLGSDDDKPKRKEKRRKGGKSGFLAPLQLLDALVNFLGMGESALSRANVVKRMWDYIKQHDLQDTSDRRSIICDEKLKELFDVDSFHGFAVSKLLSAHFVKT